MRTELVKGITIRPLRNGETGAVQAVFDRLGPRSRLLRFGGEAILAFYYGGHIVSWLKSDTFEYIAAFLVVVALLGTALGVIQLLRSTPGARSKRRAA